MSELADPKGPWAAAIGRGLVAFGNIEFITLHCLKLIPRDRIQRSTSSFKLGQRIALINELLEAHQVESARELSRHLNRALGLAHTRNLVAHNPIFIDFYQGKDGDWLHVQRIRSVANPKKTLTLSEVQQFADDAENIAQDLYQASDNFLKLLGDRAVA